MILGRGWPPTTEVSRVKQLDAKGEARQKQPVQLEQMKEQQVVQSTRDHKLQQEQIQQQSVGVTKLGCLAEVSGQEAHSGLCSTQGSYNKIVQWTNTLNDNVV